MSNYGALPVPALERISLYLSFRDLLSCSHLCQHWRLFYAYTIHWDRICRRTGVSNSVLNIVSTHCNDQFSQRYYMEAYFAHIRLTGNWKCGRYHLKNKDIGWEVTAMDYKGGLLAIAGSFRMELWNMIPDMTKVNVVSLMNLEQPRDVILHKSFVMVVGRMYDPEELSTEMMVFKIHNPRNVELIYTRQIDMGCRPVVYLTSNGIAVWVNVKKRGLPKTQTDEVGADPSKDTKVNADGRGPNCNDETVASPSKDTKVNPGVPSQSCDPAVVTGSSKDTSVNCDSEVVACPSNDRKVDLGIIGQTCDVEEVDGGYVSGSISTSLTDNVPSVRIEDVIMRRYSFSAPIPKVFHKFLWPNRVKLATHDDCLYATLPAQHSKVFLLKWSFSVSSANPTLVFQKDIGRNSIQDIKIAPSTKMVVVASVCNIRVFEPDGSLSVNPFGQRQGRCCVKGIEMSTFSDIMNEKLQLLVEPSPSKDVILVGYSNAIIYVYTTAGIILLLVITTGNIEKFMLMKQYLVVSLQPLQHGPPLVTLQQFGRGTNISTMQYKEGSRPWRHFVKADVTGVCITSSIQGDCTSLQYLDFAARSSQFQYEKSKFHSSQYLNQKLCAVRCLDDLFIRIPPVEEGEAEDQF